MHLAVGALSRGTLFELPGPRLGGLILREPWLNPPGNRPQTGVPGSEALGLGTLGSGAWEPGPILVGATVR